MIYYTDTAQAEILEELDKQLKAGKLKEVCDTPKFWQRFTTVELDYILKFHEDSSNTQE